MTETVTCCERNGFADKAEQCKCGRLCPEGRVDLSAILTRRVAERDMLRQCCASGQADSRQIAAHIAAGELRLTEQEGVKCDMSALSFRDHYAALWDRINGSKPDAKWDANPWVWAVSFRRVQP